VTSARPLSEILPTEMRELRVRPLFVLLADVAPPIIVGNTPGVDRRIGIVTGGRFEGERLRGTNSPRRQRLADHPTRRRRLGTQRSYGS
jgi:hypothetical protein